MTEARSVSFLVPLDWPDMPGKYGVFRQFVAHQTREIEPLGPGLASLRLEVSSEWLGGNTRIGYVWVRAERVLRAVGLILPTTDLFCAGVRIYGARFNPRKENPPAHARPVTPYASFHLKEEPA